jgi:cysteine sulfinate desulfinase/cysteine desulfurase-like protein
MSISHDSHVLKAIGLSKEESRNSLRICLGRFNTSEDVDFIVAAFSVAFK